MPAATSDLSASIHKALRKFLDAGGVERFFVAQGSLPPPPLAYMVSFPRLSVTLSGTDRVELERGGAWRTIRASRGDAVFVPANVANRPTWSGRSNVLTILFGRRHTGVSLVASAGANAPPVLKAQIDPPPESPMIAMLAALTGLAAREPTHPAGPHLATAILHSAQALLEDEPRARGTKAHRTYQSICLYAQEHFHLPLTRESVAEQFRLSPSHVSRLFRRQGAMTFGEYLNWVRIDRAKLLLSRHDFSIAEIAARCGFLEASYFCRVFKNGARVTPTQYRVGLASSSMGEQR